MRWLLNSTSSLISLSRELLAFDSCIHQTLKSFSTVSLLHEFIFPYLSIFKTHSRYHQRFINCRSSISPFTYNFLSQPIRCATRRNVSQQRPLSFIKVSSFEFTPENPKYYSSTWKRKGQLNEHIVASAVYAYDVHNVSDSQIAFRQETPIDSKFYQYGPGLHRPQKRAQHVEYSNRLIQQVFKRT